MFILPRSLHQPGAIKAAAYLAIMDAQFQMLQCGYFQATTITSVSPRNGYAVIAGHARQYEDAETKLEARVHQLLQKTFGGAAGMGFSPCSRWGNRTKTDGPPMEWVAAAAMEAFTVHQCTIAHEQR